jgi:hypothetical protein
MPFSVIETTTPIENEMHPGAVCGDYFAVLMPVTYQLQQAIRSSDNIGRIITRTIPIGFSWIKVKKN